MSFKIVYHHINPKRNEVIFEDSKLTVETIPLKHRVPCCGFLFKEKPLLRNIKKVFVENHIVPISQIQKIKEGEDFITESGDRIPNNEITLPPFKQRSYAYCTDTAYYEKIIAIIQNVDLLFHEATYASNLKKMAKDTFHSTSEQAATIAKKASVGKLIIGHFSARYKDLTALENEAKAIFENTVVAEDGERHTIPLTR